MSCACRPCRSRSPLSFIALLFNSFQAFGELPVQMMGRPIMWRQVGYAQYRPAALSLAQTFADIPFTTVQIVLFSIIIYFMSGLYLNAGAFFSFFAFICACRRGAPLIRQTPATSRCRPSSASRAACARRTRSRPGSRPRSSSS